MSSTSSAENNAVNAMPASYQLQFNAARAEILKRMEFEHQLMALTLAGAGTLLTIGLATKGQPLSLLIYPLIATFTAVGWLFNNLRISQLGYYIRTRYEEPAGEETTDFQWDQAGFQWETFLSEEAKDITPLSAEWQIDLLSARGIFFGSQIVFLVIAIGRLCSPECRVDGLIILLLAAAVAFTAITGFLLFRRAATGSVGLNKEE